MRYYCDFMVRFIDNLLLLQRVSNDIKLRINTNNILYAKILLKW